MKYPRIVEAALAETTSKFALAEALARDIPARREGQAATAAGQPTIQDELTEARAQIINAGGEPRGTKTLEQYRKTALWVKGSEVGPFRWLPGTSFSAHNEARSSGLTYEQFTQLPAKSVDAVRLRAGWAGTDGPPAAIVEKMTDEQVQEVAADPRVRQAVSEQRTEEMTRPLTGEQKARRREAHDQLHSALQQGISKFSLALQRVLGDWRDMVKDLRNINEGGGELPGDVYDRLVEVTQEQVLELRFYAAVHQLPEPDFTRTKQVSN
jgi:hypothetical protein